MTSLIFDTSNTDFPQLQLHLHHLLVRRCTETLAIEIEYSTSVRRTELRCHIHTALCKQLRAVK